MKLSNTLDFRCHEAVMGDVNQLIEVLRKGSRGSIYNVSHDALEGLFEDENIKYSDVVRQAI